MKIGTKIVEIPAKVYEQVVYYAEDGKEFISQKDCELYEMNLKTNNHPVFKNSKDIYTYPKLIAAKAYYFNSKDDYTFFLKSQYLHESDYFFYSDYQIFGDGWYIFWEEEYENSHDEYYLKNLDNYIAEIAKEFKNWEKKIRIEISNKEYS